MARGLFALHTRRATRPFEELMAPAEQLARFGTEVSRGLAADLAAVSGPLLADPAAQAIFGRPGGGPKQAGETIVQPELAGTLGQLRLAGVGDMHQGTLARRLEETSRTAGGNLTARRAARRPAGPAGAARPGLAAAATGSPSCRRRPMAAWPPPPPSRRCGAAPTSPRGMRAAWPPRPPGAPAGGDPKALIAATDLPPGAARHPAGLGRAGHLRPAGHAVSCAFTMNNLFGTGRVVPGLGFLLAAAPGIGAVQPPLLSAAIAYNPNLRGFRLAVAASGQQSAPIGVAGPAALQLLRALPAGCGAGGRRPGHRAGPRSPPAPTTCRGGRTAASR